MRARRRPSTAATLQPVQAELARELGAPAPLRPPGSQRRRSSRRGSRAGGTREARRACAPRGTDRSHGPDRAAAPAVRARSFARRDTRRRGSRSRRARPARPPARSGRPSSRRRRRSGPRLSPESPLSQRDHSKHHGGESSSRSTLPTAAGCVNRWCAPSSTPVSPTSRNVAGVSGLTGNPTRHLSHQRAVRDAAPERTRACASSRRRPGARRSRTSRDRTEG